MSPILTRPVREQLEHDRVIRQLHAKYKRRTDVVINPGNEQNQSVTVGELVVFPDVLVFAEGTKRLLITVEVETGESVNPIEARAEWGVYSKLKVPLHLYVPPQSVEAVRRLCDEYQIVVAELWTYTTSFDQVRFTMVHRSPDAPTVRVPAAKPAPTVRQAPGRPDQSTGSRSPRPVDRLKVAPSRVEGRVQSRGEPSRAAKPKPVATSRPAQAAPKPKPKPVAKPKPAAKARPKAKPAAKKSTPAAKPKSKAAKVRKR